MTGEDEYPDDMPSPEETLGLDESGADMEDAYNKVLEGHEEVEGESVKVYTGDGEVIVMPGADCSRCGSVSDGVIVAVGDNARWSGGDANPYCEECKEEMFPRGVGEGFDWREF